jgi:hypothetical protein
MAWRSGVAGNVTGKERRKTRSAAFSAIFSFQTKISLFDHFRRRWTLYLLALFMRPSFPKKKETSQEPIVRKHSSNTTEKISSRPIK